MATRTQKAKVAAFLFACVCIVVSVSVIISGLYEKAGDNYFIEFNETVLGIYEGGLVEYLGVPVGKVVQYWVTTDNLAHVEIIVNPEKVTLREGVEAQLVIYSLATGSMAIELIGGELDARRIELGSQIPTKTSLIGSLSTSVGDIVDNLGSILKTFNSGLDGTEEGDFKKIFDEAKSALKKMNEFLDGGGEFVDEATDTVQQLRGKVEGLLDDFKVLGEDMSGLIHKADKLVTVTTGKIEDVKMPELQERLTVVLERIATVSANLNTVLEDFDTLSETALHEISNLEHSLRTSLGEITDTFETVRNLGDQLQKDPSSIVRGKANVKDAKE